MRVKINRYMCERRKEGQSVYVKDRNAHIERRTKKCIIAVFTHDPVITYI